MRNPMRNSGLKNLKPKIVVDSSVLIPACISYKIPETGEEIQHVFHRPSAGLFEFFRKNPGAGCLLPKVDTESESVLGTAVRTIFDARFPSNPGFAGSLNDMISHAILACGIRMTDLKRLLVSEDLDKRLVDENLKSVKTMSAHLVNKWDNSDKSDKQLLKFMAKHPNSCDEQILAKAITVMQKSGGESKEFDYMIASFDGGFFSPRMVSGRVYDVVTREIQDRFGYHCDRPPGILSRSGGRSQGP